MELTISVNARNSGAIARNVSWICMRFETRGEFPRVHAFTAFRWRRLEKKSYVNYLITLTIQLAIPMGNHGSSFDIAVNYRRCDPV